MSLPPPNNGPRSSGYPQRYRNIPIDPSIPIIPASSLLSIPSTRHGRRSRAKPLDSNAQQSYGAAVIQKAKSTTRLYFQNVNGLTHTSTLEDYRYYLSCLQAYEADIVGLSETNTCWTHSHLRSDFKSAVHSFHKQNKISFGSPSHIIDPCPTKEHHQAGGNLTLVKGPMTARVYGDDIRDTSGLGRWSGFTLSASSTKN